MIKTAQHMHSLPFMPQLDSLRALSVLAVIYTHFVWEKYWLFGVYWGALGVRCFFVLSGFLITSILVRDLDIVPSFKTVYLGFIARRALRLYPVLLVTLIVAAALGIGTVRETVLWNIAYLTNFYTVKIDDWPKASAHLWSLAVEEQFYLFWPFVIFFVPRRFLSIVFVGFIASALVFRIIWRAMGFSDFGVWVLPPGSFDALALGALLALFSKQTGVINLVGFAGICLFVASKVLAGWRLVADADIQATAAAMMFTWVIARAAAGFGGITGKILNSSILQYIGAMSYGIYVVHGFVFIYVVEELGWRWRSVLAGVAITIILASFSWHFLERPISRAGRRMVNQVYRGTTREDARAFW